MAEASAGLDIRRTILLAGVGVVIIFGSLFFLFRGCVASAGRNDYTTIYSNLDLKDSANVVTQLTKLAIPYKLGDNGKSIAVQKSKADQARIGLAEKNLPAGGVVGWEIFDESKLGATDFDRRIQLIRAISGELSRTINRIAGVDSARVQIVIPETRLFATTAPPVTASVMLRLKPGFELSTEKINGIVHMVASSVENLQPENVMVIDDTGRILTSLAYRNYSPIVASTESIVILSEQSLTSPEVVAATQEVAASLEVVSSEVVTAIVTPQALSLEERIMLKVKAKKQLENDLSGKAQEILNRFYPPKSAIIKVDVDFKASTKEASVSKDFQIGKLNTIILIDNRVDLSSDLKDSTYKAVAAVIGYDKRRGDKIILQKVPFHLAAQPTALLADEVNRILPPKDNEQKNLQVLVWLKNMIWPLAGLLAAILLLTLIWLTRRKPAQPVPPETSLSSFEHEKNETAGNPLEQTPRPSAVNNIKSMAEQNPEQVAELLKKWLSEGQ